MNEPIRHDPGERRVAWRVEIDGKTCIVFAATKPKARWIAVKSFREAGYGYGEKYWPPVCAWREDRMDASRFASEPPKALTEEAVISSL